MSTTAKWDAYVAYFDQQVLASYRSESDKWTVENDFFEGHLRISSIYYETLDETQRDVQYVDIRFGFRTLASGELAVAAFSPDLGEKSKGHVDRWRGLMITDPQWAEDDKRFDLWARRCLEGDWSVDNGVRAQLGELIETCRSLTGAVLGVPLFGHSVPNSLPFPAADNTHRYQDAHSELYRYLVDGLDKTCLEALKSRTGSTANVRSNKTVTALRDLLPGLDADGPFNRAVSLVSEQRGLADHHARQPARPFGAFEKFTEDLRLAVDGLRELLGVLERTLGVEPARAVRRWNAMKNMPRITRPAEPNYSICQADEMVGKTVARVEYGFRHDIEGVHQSELLIIHFTDGSVACIDTGSNAGNLASRHESKPGDFRVDLRIQWVPSLQPAASPSGAN